MPQTDENFERKFREGRRYQIQLYLWLLDHRIRANLEAYSLRERGAEADAAKRGERPDEPDIWLPDHGFAIEVKGRNIWFKYCKDFRLPSIHVCSENSFEKMRASGIPRAAMVLVSMPTLHMLAVPWEPDLWWIEQATEKTKEGTDTFNVMAAKPNQLRPMSWLLRLLRQDT